MFVEDSLQFYYEFLNIISVLIGEILCSCKTYVVRIGNVFTNCNMTLKIHGINEPVE